MLSNAFSKFWPKGGLSGILHHYTETLVTFEYTSYTSDQPHSILFLGGLGDGLATTSYMADLAFALQQTKWSLFTLNLTSSYQSWGLGHLDRDTEEIAQCVRYIKEYKADKFGDVGKLVIMGHSTGSQCVLHYLYRPNPHTDIPAFDPCVPHTRRPQIDGAIMQAPVSDREAVQWVLSEGLGDRTPAELRIVYEKMKAIAEEAVQRETSFDTMLPLSLTSQIYPPNVPISCRRFLSLISPDSPTLPKEDDLFSSDLGDEQLGKTFGMVKQMGLLKSKLLVLVSGADQSVPCWVDKTKLLSKWKNAVNHNGKEKIWDEEYSGIIPGASHALSNDDQAEPRRDLCRRVLGYLYALEGV